MAMELLTNFNNQTHSFSNTADVDSLMLLLPQSHSHQQMSAFDDVAVDKFKRVILGRTRTGHARFRRGPMQAMCPDPIRETGSFGNAVKRKCESGGSEKCCSKKRKNRERKVLRVAAISSKMSDIPPDDYSWRKYGQKPIKGSPHPRGYYKCSSVKGCLARKHVEKALDDPNMVIVTYEADHNHSLSVCQWSYIRVVLIE